MLCAFPKQPGALRTMCKTHGFQLITPKHGLPRVPKWHSGPLWPSYMMLWWSPSHHVLVLKQNLRWWEPWKGKVSQGQVVGTDIIIFLNLRRLEHKEVKEQKVPAWALAGGLKDTTNRLLAAGPCLKGPMPHLSCLLVPSTALAFRH